LKGWELNILKEKKSHGLKDHPNHHYESNPESEVRFEIESNLEASQVPMSQPQDQLHIEI